MVAEDLRRVLLDLQDYSRRSQANPCFICKIVDGTHEFPHGEIYRDDFAVVFLNRFPTLLGYTLVAPLEPGVEERVAPSLEMSWY